MAYLYMAFGQPSMRSQSEYFEKAFALKDKVSRGERLWIAAVEAQTRGDLTAERELFEQLATAYPNDERAHTLLGNFYLGLREYTLAIEQYEKAIKINPEFSQPYNQMGYAYRYLGELQDAERAFRKYIKLIPDDPNPYDSYADLLMKMGRFNASIESYEKALTFNPYFVPSHVGIAMNLMLKGKHEKARDGLEDFYDRALSDAQRRSALFAVVISYVDEGEITQALNTMNRQYALAERIDDTAAMAADLNTMGSILLQAGKYDSAQVMYEKSLKLVEESGLREEAKSNARLSFLFASARVALMKKDLGAAKAASGQYREQAEVSGNPFRVRRSHYLSGTIAFGEKDFDKALEEYSQADQRDPCVLYRIAQTYEAKGDLEEARDMYDAAANFNQFDQFSSLSYAFVRNDARRKVNSLQSI
jgi:tetratricopeptide (TPR) repeat protein